MEEEEEEEEEEDAREGPRAGRASWRVLGCASTFPPGCSLTVIPVGLTRASRRRGCRCVASKNSLTPRYVFPLYPFLQTKPTWPSRPAPFVGLWERFGPRASHDTLLRLVATAAGCMLVSFFPSLSFARIAYDVAPSRSRAAGVSPDVFEGDLTSHTMVVTVAYNDSGENELRGIYTTIRSPPELRSVTDQLGTPKRKHLTELHESSSLSLQNKDSKCFQK